MDQDKFEALLIWSCAQCRLSIENCSADEYADWIEKALRYASDCRTPRLRRSNGKKSAYWWSEEIQELRKRAILSRRKWRRAVKKNTRRDGEFQDMVDRSQLSYRLTKKSLRSSIITAKARAWEEFVGLVDEESWGLPYKLVIGRLRPAARPMTETLDPEMVERLVNLLFPDGLEIDPRTMWMDPMMEKQCEVTASKIWNLLKERSNNSAPGLDGIPSKVLKTVPTEMLERIAECYCCALKPALFRNFGNGLS